MSDVKLLLLHGLGANGGVWAGHDGVAPDLHGHGNAPWAPAYDFERHAEAVLPLLGEEPVAVVGHSMGGVVGLVLAAMAPDRVVAVVGLGIKVTWSPTDVERVTALAERPVAWFPDRETAVARFLRVSGLGGVVPDDHPVTRSGVVHADEGWRLAQDPRSYGVGVPDVASLLDGVRCRVVLARGEHDAMVSHGELADLVDDPVSLPGLGHNAHVEDPGAVRSLVSRMLR